MQASTYRHDLRYVQTRTLMGYGQWPNEFPQWGTRERIVGPVRWWFYRVQFWRFEKFKQFDVLREKSLKP